MFTCSALVYVYTSIQASCHKLGSTTHAHAKLVSVVLRHRRDLQNYWYALAHSAYLCLWRVVSTAYARLSAWAVSNRVAVCPSTWG